MMSYKKYILYGGIIIGLSWYFFPSIKTHWVILSESLKREASPLTIYKPESAPVFVALKYLKPGDSKSYMYIPINQLTPGQLRYSQLNVQEKKNAALKKGIATKDDKGNWHYAFDNNKSILSPDNALPVVLAPFGAVLVDGHHDTGASIALEATTIPVFVMKDLSKHSRHAFWQEALKEGLVYPYTLNNEFKEPTSFAELQDDPNRFFAAIVARKCVKDPKTGKMVAVASPPTQLADYPVWIKFGNKIPFIEFKISDAMKKHDLLYDNKWGSDVDKSFVEDTRQALIEEQEQGNLVGLKVIKTRQYYTEIPDICKDN